jgi:hypothetical protein
MWCIQQSRKLIEENPFSKVLNTELLLRILGTHSESDRETDEKTSVIYCVIYQEDYCNFINIVRRLL